MKRTAQRALSAGKGLSFHPPLGESTGRSTVSGAALLRYERFVKQLHFLDEAMRGKSVQSKCAPCQCHVLCHQRVFCNLFNTVKERVRRSGREKPIGRAMPDAIRQFLEWSYSE